MTQTLRERYGYLPHAQPVINNEECCGNDVICPACKAITRVSRTLRWEDRTRIRYHRCPKCGASTKSVEEDSNLEPTH